jgi:hypothetical protein
MNNYLIFYAARGLGFRNDCCQGRKLVADPEARHLMPSQKLIRKQSLAQRLSSYPHDLLISLNEAYELLEWDSLSNTLLVPIGVGLNTIYLLARLDQYDQTSSYRGEDVFEASRVRDTSGIFGGEGRGLHTLVQSNYSKLILAVPNFVGFGGI